MSKQATSIMFFLFFLFLLSFNMEHAKGFVSLLFSQIKCGPSIRIFFCLQGFCLSEDTSLFSVGRKKQMGCG